MKFHEIISFVLVGISISSSLAVEELEEQEESCQTPSQASGSCVPIKDCKYLNDIFKKQLSVITESEKEYLQESHCGFHRREPKVCCAPDSRFTINDLPAPGICGTQSLRDRLVGGENTSISDFPWLALLWYSRGNSRAPRVGVFCGGAIINKNYILTAAHCIKGAALKRNDYFLNSVSLGEHNTLTNPDCDQDDCADSVVDVRVSEAIIHKNYESDKKVDDIALIRVARPINFTDWVKPICLPVSLKLQSKDFNNVEMIYAGFGTTETGKRSDVKKQVKLNGTTQEFCSAAYRRYNEVISPKQLCAGGEKGKDACKGDSGGPLMAEDLFNDLYPYSFMAGIVSFGPKRCGEEGVPGVHVRVSSYIDWIVNHMRP